MEAHPDFRDLLALFNELHVEYVIVGGYALAFHGAPRTTGDMDILVHATPANAAQILRALAEFGFGSVGLTSTDFENPDQVIQLGVPPVRIDLVTSLTGVSWDEVYANRVEGSYGDVTTHFIGKQQFVTNKRTTGRRKDLADLEALGES
jgi:hypothetical protein